MNFPSDTQRLAVIGATGSGKSHAAAWHLSQRDFDVMPWYIIDFKREELIDEIGAQLMAVTDPIQTRPGLYVVRPAPYEMETLTNLLWRIWQQEFTGVYFDETVQLGNSNLAFRGLLTQGRSKHIPMILCTQRPVWIDRYALSESDFFQIFRLQHEDDIGTVEKFIPRPRGWKRNESYIDARELPKYWSFYYDVHDNRLAKLRPVPDRAAILNTFRAKLARIRKVL